MPRQKNWTKKLLTFLSKITTSEKKKLEISLGILITHLGGNIDIFKKIFPGYAEFLDIIEKQKISKKIKKEIEDLKNKIVVSSIDDFLYIYNDLISNTTKDFSNGQYFTKGSVIDLMCSIADNNNDFKNKDKITIYDPSSGIGMMLIQGYFYFKTKYKDKEIYLIGQEIDEKLIEINKFLFSYFGIKNSNFKIYSGDTITKSGVLKNNDKIDLILSNPPFGNKQINIKKFKKYYFYSPIYELKDIQYYFLYHIIHIMIEQKCKVMVITTNKIYESIQKKEKMFLKYIKLFTNGIFKQKVNIFRGTSIQTLIWYLEYKDNFKEIDISSKGRLIKNSYGYSKKDIEEIISEYNLDNQEKIITSNNDFIKGKEFLTLIPLNKKRIIKKEELLKEGNFPVIYPKKQDFISGYTNDYEELVVNTDRKKVLIINDFSPDKIYQYDKPYIQMKDNVRSFIFDENKGISIESVIKQIKELKYSGFKRYTSVILNMNFKK